MISPSPRQSPVPPGVSPLSRGSGSPSRGPFHPRTHSVEATNASAAISAILSLRVLTLRSRRLRAVRRDRGAGHRSGHGGCSSAPRAFRAPLPSSPAPSSGRPCPGGAGRAPLPIPFGVPLRRFTPFTVTQHVTIAVIGMAACQICRTNWSAVSWIIRRSPSLVRAGPFSLKSPPGFDQRLKRCAGRCSDRAPPGYRWLRFSVITTSNSIRPSSCSMRCRSAQRGETVGSLAHDSWSKGLKADGGVPHRVGHGLESGSTTASEGTVESSRVLLRVPGNLGHAHPKSPALSTW